MRNGTIPGSRRCTSAPSAKKSSAPSLLTASPNGFFSSPLADRFGIEGSTEAESFFFISVLFFVNLKEMGRFIFYLASLAACAAVPVDVSVSQLFVARAQLHVESHSDGFQAHMDRVAAKGTDRHIPLHSWRCAGLELPCGQDGHRQQSRISAARSSRSSLPFASRTLTSWRGS